MSRISGAILVGDRRREPLRIALNCAARKNDCPARPYAYRSNTPSLRYITTLTVVFAYLCITGLSHAAPQAEPTIPHPVLTTVAQVRQLTREQAAMGYPVRVKGVVVYSESTWPAIIVSDRTGGIFVEDMPHDLKGADPGTRVEVEGWSRMDGFAPSIVQTKVNVLGRGPVPRPRRPSLERLIAGEEDGQWIEVEGIVHSTAAKDGRLMLGVAVVGSHLMVSFKTSPPPDRDLLVGSKVRIRGAGSVTYNKRDQLTGISLLASSLADLEVVAAGPRDPFSIPVSSIRSVLQFTPGSPPGRRTHIRGVVTFANSGVLFIQDANGALSVTVSQNSTVHPGDEVDAVGFPSVGTNSPVLEDSIVRLVRTGMSIKPVLVSADKVLRGDLDAKLVEIEGMLMSRSQRGGQQVLAVRSGNVIFKAEMADPHADRPLASVRDGSRIRVRGICITRNDYFREPQAFNVLLRDSDDVVVVKNAPWWTLGRALLILAIAVILSLVALVWVMVLRRRVRAQTLTICQRLEREMALEKRFYYVARASNDAVWDWDMATGSVWWNEGVTTIFGYGGEEVTPDVGWWRERIHPLDRDAVKTTIDAVIHGDAEKWSGEYRFLRKDGVYAFVHDRGFVMRNHEGEAVRMIRAMADISDRMRTEQALREAKDVAELASRTKSEFLANMSHEIRTPMNGVIGMTELALDTDLTSQQREYLGVIRSSARSLLGIINEVLDFSKIEAGKLNVTSAEFGLEDLVQEVMQIFTLETRRKGLELLLDIHPDVPGCLLGDAPHLKQILVNLVGNAVKFTETGEIILRICLAPEPEYLHFTVSDTGIGIPANDHKTIFEAFAQVDGSATRRYSGTGLGLAICSRLVNLMGGHLWVDSEYGRGSDFHFIIPCPAASGSSRQVAPAELATVRNIRVLVVDDNETNRIVLRDTLRPWNMVLELAASAQEALALIRQRSAEGRSFELLLIDARMPDVDGFTLAKTVQGDPVLSGPRILILSSMDLRGGDQRLPGFVDECLQKPVLRSTLLRAIVRVLRPPSGDGIVEPRPAVRLDAKSLKVLVAEDNPVNQKVATLLLRRAGHHVTVAGNGRDAVDIFTQSTFDIVLMDIQMPLMSGLEATRVIRELEAVHGRRTPIIAVTAHAMNVDRDRCLDAGMDDILIKPFQASELDATLARWGKTAGIVSHVVDTIAAEI
jgi:PAS domain S-box-containing protein